MSWPPHVTVATVVQRNDEFLFVEEIDNRSTVFNQPAGHLEPNESITQAAVRETLEETAWEVELLGLVGIYQYYSEHNDTTYLRICFAAKPILKVNQPIDPDITAVHWLKRSQIDILPMRSPLVMQCLEDALSKPLQPLDCISTL